MYESDYELMDFAYVAHRIAAGDRVRFIHDYYGGQWIELQHRLFFWDKRRVQLTPEEMQKAKAEILAKRRGTRRDRVARVAC